MLSKAIKLLCISVCFTLVSLSSVKANQPSIKAQILAKKCEEPAHKYSISCLKWKKRNPQAVVEKNVCLDSSDRTSVACAKYRILRRDALSEKERKKKYALKRKEDEARAARLALEKKKKAELMEKKRREEAIRVALEKERRIKESQRLRPVSSGTSFAVSSEGHLVTNNHVIKGCIEVKVHHNGKASDVTIIANDTINDIAVLKAEFNPSSILAFSRKNPALMEDIYVAGYPFGSSVSSSLKVTKGIISSLSGLGNNYSNLQIDAALQPGNSGGPIFDNKGNVVGVAVAKLDLATVVEAYGVVPENTNFGIKANVISNLLAANGITAKSPNKRNISKIQLGEEIENATFHLSCWMTMAQVKKMRTQKVIFENLR